MTDTNAYRFWEHSYPPALRGYRLDERLLPESLSVLASDARTRFGDRTAFTTVLPNGLSTSLSYADLDDCSNDFVAYLAGTAGFAIGDVVAIQLPNSSHYPIAVFGAWKAGLVVTNVNPLYTERELRAQLQDSGAKILVTHSLSLETAARVAAETGIRIVAAGLWEFFPTPVAAAIEAALSTETGPGGATLISADTSFANALANAGSGRPAPTPCIRSCAADPCASARRRRFRCRAAESRRRRRRSLVLVRFPRRSRRSGSRSRSRSGRPPARP